MMTEMDIHYQQNADKGMIYTPEVGMLLVFWVFKNAPV